MKVEFLPDAEQELIDAAFDYEERVPGLGTRFATEVSRVIDILVDHPLIGPKLDSLRTIGVAPDIGGRECRNGERRWPPCLSVGCLFRSTLPASRPS